MLKRSDNESEDCLTLDVSVPAAALDRVRGIRPDVSDNTTTPGTSVSGLPVAVWFHDGQ